MVALREGDWVLIADGEKALFLVNEGDDRNLNLEVWRKKTQDNPPDGVQSANRRGRQAESAGSSRYAYEDTDWHELAKERFADDLADILYKRAHANDFSRIVICAAPATLGELRSKLHKTVSEKVVAEIDKDLSNHPVDEIETQLAETLRGK
jgi:protein required for attachment to host cells